MRKQMIVLVSLIAAVSAGATNTVSCTDPVLAAWTNAPSGVFVDSVEDLGDGIAVKFTTELAGPYVVGAYPVEQMEFPAVPLAETVVRRGNTAFLTGRFFDLSYFVVVSTTNWIERPACFNNAYNGRTRRTMTPAEIAAIRKRTTEAAVYRNDDTDPGYSKEPFDNSGYTQPGRVSCFADPSGAQAGPVWAMFFPWTHPVVRFSMEVSAGVDTNAVTSSSANRVTAFHEPKTFDFCFTNDNPSASLRGYRVLFRESTGAVLIREAYSSNPHRSDYFVVNRGFKSLSVHGGYKLGVDWKGRKYFQKLTPTE